jgi:signal peptidase I
MSEEKKEEVVKSRRVAPPKSTAREYFESFVVTLIMAIFGMTFVIQAVTVPTGSMQNTILIGDYLLVNKFIFAPGGKPLPFFPQREIERGDIIVFKYPGNKVDPEQDIDMGVKAFRENYVKRVIGLPGETIEFKDNHVYINGSLLSEHRIETSNASVNAEMPTKQIEPRQSDQKYDVYYSERTMDAVERGQNTTANFEFGVTGKPMKIPDDSYFVMGDNRDNSGDSRVWGFVHRDLVIGRAMFVYWSCDRVASGGSMFGCLTHPRLNRIGKMIK